MILEECRISLNRTSKELRTHGTPAFPCAGFRERYSKEEETNIPWHWHDELEVIYIHKGSLHVELPNRTIPLSQGDCLCINAGVLHFASTDSYCELHSLVYHPLLLTGSTTSIFATMYIEPLLLCTAFDGCLFVGDAVDKQDGIQYFKEAYEAFSAQRIGYEFIVREKLSHLCLGLYMHYEQNISKHVEILDMDSIRLKNMLAYIHEHYAEEIELSQIANAANIGIRECLRCFKRVITLSPMQYVMEYRIEQGAMLLSQHADMSISDIANQCGFESPSNFSQIFKRYYSCTPRAYRKKQN